MPGPVAIFVWFLGISLELCFVVCSVYRKSFFRYLFLNLYFLISIAASLGRYGFLKNYGQGSEQYTYFYYYTDALLTLALYVALISLFSYVFSELGVGKYIRLCAVLLLGGTALFSYAVVAQSADRLSGQFAYELSQNLYFVGLVLTFILWGAVLKLRETRTRLVQFILALGLYFSAYAACYALMNLSLHYSLIEYFPQAIACFLPLSWLITMMRYTEESRLEPAQLVAVPR